MLRPGLDGTAPEQAYVVLMRPPIWKPILGSPLRRIAVAILVLVAAGACRGVSPAGPAPANDLAARERFARRSLEEARAFRSQRRLPQAEGALRRGLTAQPDAADLHRTLARVLEDLGRSEEAEAHWRRADEIDPPPPPPPDRPLDLPSRGALLILLAPEPSDEHPQRVARDWPRGVVAETLERRLRVRLPEATLVHAEAETVARAREWLSAQAPRAAISLRADRAYCGESLKDGAFALAWLRVASGVPGTPSRGPEWVREVVSEPRPEHDCESEALARALEAALDLPAAEAALRAPRQAGATWSTETLRALFPALGRRIREQIDAGRRRLASGDLAAAEEAFLRAARIDPEDPELRAYLQEVEATLALSRSLPGTSEADPDTLDPRLTATQRAALEARLAEERRRRDDLLAALAVVEEAAQLPPEGVLAALPPTMLPDPDAFGPVLARSRAGGDVEVRSAFAPGGALLARYYFPIGAELPVLREEDSDRDQRPDRWIGYEGSSRREIWEDARGTGRPDVRLLFAPGGTPLERIELDGDGDGRPERVFDYAEGVLRVDSNDTDGDGVLDRFDHFDAQGELELREEDLDGDGRIDLRSIFRAGKLTRRKVATPEPAASPVQE
jgi:tetratricopeptide (TPR) repeat protein